MGDYSRYSLQGALAGLILAIPLSILATVLMGQLYPDALEEILRYQLSRSLPPEYIEEALRQAMGSLEATLNVIRVLTPLLTMFQQVLLGAIFGLLKGFLRLRLGLGEALSTIISGLTYVLLLGIAPVAILELTQPELLRILKTYVGNPYLLAVLPGTFFTVSLVLVSYASWIRRRVVESSPKEF